MPGALRSLSSPPVPNPDAQPGALQGTPGPMPAGAPPAGAPMQVPPQMPAPTHAQTVAALRHFAAIGKQLEIALKDPDLGKADIKSKVIDGMTTLVGSRMISPGQAVSQLSTFPERPFEQKQWLMDHMNQITQARDHILGHHGVAFAGGGPEAAPSADSHMDDVSGMMQAHYARN